MPFCEIFLTIADEKDAKSRVTFPCEIPTFNDAGPAAQAVAALIDPLVTGGIVGAGVTINVDPDVVGDIAAVGSDVQEGARFVFKSALAFLKSVRLPSFDEGKMVPASTDVDAGDADVFAFTTGITDGVDLVATGGTGLVTFTTTHQEDLVDFTTATEDWGRNR